LRLSNSSAVAEETEEKHQTADADENVNALIDQLRLGESLQKENKKMLEKFSGKSLQSFKQVAHTK
jgi:hypothetical protein